MREFDHAVKLAHKILDRVHGDPDDDLAVLARQFLRSVERESGKEPDAEFDWDALQRLRYARAEI